MLEDEDGWAGGGGAGGEDVWGASWVEVAAAGSIVEREEGRRDVRTGKRGEQIFIVKWRGAENKNRMGLALLRQSLGMAVIHQEFSAFATPPLPHRYPSPLAITATLGIGNPPAVDHMRLVVVRGRLQVVDGVEAMPSG